MSLLKELKFCRLNKDYNGFIRIYNLCDARKSQIYLQELFYFLFERKKFSSCIVLMGYMALNNCKLTLHQEITRRVIANHYLNGNLQLAVYAYVYWIALEFKLFKVREFFWLIKYTGLEVNFLENQLFTFLTSEESALYNEYKAKKYRSPDQGHLVQLPKKISTCVIISGQLRACEETLKHYSNVFKNAPNLKIILSTWDQLGVPRPERLFDSENFKSHGFDYLKIDGIELKKVINFYNHKNDSFVDYAYLNSVLPSIDVVDIQTLPIEFKDGVLFGKNYPSFLKNTSKGSLAMFYKIKRGWELMEDLELVMNQKFDIVVRVRPDLVFSEAIPERVFKNALLYQRLMVGELFPGHCDDQIAIGCRRHMEVYSSVFDELNFYWNKEWINNNCQDCVEANAEQLLFQFLDRKDLKIERFTFSKPVIYDYKIKYSEFQSIVNSKCL